MVRVIPRKELSDSGVVPRRPESGGRSAVKVVVAWRAAPRAITLAMCRLFAGWRARNRRAPNGFDARSPDWTPPSAPNCSDCWKRLRSISTGGRDCPKRKPTTVAAPVGRTSGSAYRPDATNLLAKTRQQVSSYLSQRSRRTSRPRGHPLICAVPSTVNRHVTCANDQRRR